MAISAALGSAALLPAGLGFRNLVINGGFDVWQRTTSLAIGTTQATSYAADRWSAYRTAGGCTQSRQAAELDGFQYCYRLQRNNGNSGLPRIYTGTSFETSTVAKMQNLPVVLSLYARKGVNFSATSDAFRVTLYTGTGPEANGIYTGFTNINTVINQTATLTTSWQRFVYFGVMPATATQLLIELSYVPVGTAGAADYVDITGVQLEQNLQITPFEQRPYGIELGLCQRYFHIVPATDMYAINPYWNVSLSSGNQVINYKWPVPMRVAPTIRTSAGSATALDFTYYQNAAGAGLQRFLEDTGASSVFGCRTLLYGATNNSGNNLPLNGYTVAQSQVPFWVNAEL